ncbi:Sensor histidine kinase TmoS [bacterium HR12]|nr:Sensor histidine kinase TmoS [bacterium HR12]
MTTPGAELRRLRSLVADLDAVVWEADAASGRFTFVSQRAWDMLGYPPKFWIEEPSFWADHIHPEDRDRAVQAFLDAISRGGAHDLEYRFLHRDGHVVWLRDIGHTLTDPRGNPTVARGLLVDITRQKQAEERRAEIERRYRMLVEQLPGIVYLEGVEEGEGPGRILYVGPQIEAILGVRPEEWLTDPTGWVRHVHPEDLPGLLEAERQALRGDGRFRAEYRAIARDGREVRIHDEAVLIRDPDGRPLFWQGVMFDVTERHRADERAELSEARFRMLVESVPAIIYTEAVRDAEGGVTYVSPQVRRFGYEPEEWLGPTDRWVAFVHPEDRERIRELNLRCDETLEPFSAEYRVMTRDGAVVWVRDEAVCLRAADGTPLYWQGVITDVTERKRAEEQLREAEERYRALVENIPIVTYVDAFGGGGPPTSLYFSPQVTELLGYTPEELTRPEPLWPSLIHPEDRERIRRAAEEADRTQGPYDVEYRMIARDGRVVWVNDRAVLVRDEEGRPRYWQGVWVDITERKRAEELERALAVERAETEKLRELDRMKNTFLQAVSHDLRTPLAAILGLAVTLEREDVELRPGEARELAARIAANARRLDRMVNDLLDLDRLSRGIVEPSLAPTDVGGLARNLVAESDLVAGRTVAVEAPSVWAEVDAAKVERILENLLANAVRHTPPESRIWIRVLPGEEDLVIAVEDEGLGVPPEDRERIFEPFRQGPTAPEHSPGVGIGLALVARFAELHGGRAWVEDRPGGGASFRVRLPRRPPRA